MWNKCDWVLFPFMIIDCNDAPIEMNERQSARAMNEQAIEWVNSENKSSIIVSVFELSMLSVINRDCNHLLWWNEWSIISQCRINGESKFVGVFNDKSIDIRWPGKCLAFNANPCIDFSCSRPHRKYFHSFCHGRQVKCFWQMSASFLKQKSS